MKSVEELTKEELRENINETYGALHQFMGVSNELNSFYPAVPHFRGKSALISAIPLFSLLLIGGLTQSFPLLFAAIPAQILSIPISKFILKKNFIKNRDLNIEENADRIEQLRTKQGEIAEDIFRKTVIPEDYLTIPALEKFGTYLANYRASNLTECINLYETELREQQVMEGIYHLQQTQLETNNLLNLARQNINTINHNLSDINTYLESISKHSFHTRYK